MTELIDHGKTGLLCDPSKLETLASAMQHYFQHPQEAKAAGQQGRDRLLADFTKNIWLEKIHQVYKKMDIPFSAA